MAVRSTLACRHFHLASPASAVAPPDAAVQPPPPVMMPSATATGGARAERLHASSAPVLNDSTLAALRERGYAVVENFLSLDEAAALRIDASEARPVVEPLGQAFNLERRRVAALARIDRLGARAVGAHNQRARLRERVARAARVAAAKGLAASRVDRDYEPLFSDAMFCTPRRRENSLPRARRAAARPSRAPRRGAAGRARALR